MFKPKTNVGKLRSNLHVFKMTTINHEIWQINDFLTMFVSKIIFKYVLRWFTLRVHGSGGH